MEFWGVEVKKGEPLKVMASDGVVLHLSQACLGEQKKEKKETICLFVEVDGKKLVLATLSTEKCPQQQFDLVFDRDFELTHNWKNGSVFFYGYKAPFGDEVSDDEEPQPGAIDVPESEEEKEEIPLPVANNGKSKGKKSVQAETSNAEKKKESGSGKQKVQIVEPSKDEESSEDDSEEDSDEDMSGDEMDSENDEDEDDDESDDSDEETPKKAVPSKKRPAESTSKTPAADKKIKVTPQKTDGKKANVHVATPHPAKQAKTPANQPKQQTPKSGGTHTCASCNKAFGSDKALDSHSKAKHGAK